MQEAGLQPDEVSYNAVIGACAKKGEAARAEGWLSKMQEAGLEVAWAAEAMAAWS